MQLVVISWRIFGAKKLKMTLIAQDFVFRKFGNVPNPKGLSKHLAKITIYPVKTLMLVYLLRLYP